MESVTKITATAAAQKFISKPIVCRYRVPWEIVTDNGCQFDAAKFKEFYEGIGIKICFALVGHPESNEVVERAYGNLLARLTTHLVRMSKGLSTK